MATPHITNRERATMRAMRRDHLSLEAIAGHTGRSVTSVARHTGDLGVRCRPGRPGLGPDGYARLLAAHEAGASPDELASRFGLTRSSVAPTLSRLRRARRLATQETPAC